jgi:FKBP-type peptidyl-prolyl cis-trans isomerase FkpA
MPSPAELKESLLNANKIYAKRESDEIDQYIKQHKWNVTGTGTGLQYIIFKKGIGEQARAGQLAKVNYKISLLDGTLCYSSDETGPKQFLIDQDDVESGLHEGIKYMKVGDRAILIIPSHLAHGLIGDESKIPPQATLIFDLELLELR